MLQLSENSSPIIIRIKKTTSNKSLVPIRIENTECNVALSLKSAHKMGRLNEKSVKEKDISLDLVTYPRSAITKKKKHSLTNENKSKMWDLFDTEVEKTDEKTVPIEYDDVGLCSLCNTSLMTSEEGFPICSNKTCGVLYKHTLDYSPEWRFYGADDKNAADPTRCGNPINPLLVESSFGCKIICTSKSSYEMKRIRKWTEWQAMPHKEKSLYDEFQFITIMAQNSGIPKIFIDDAMSIHKDMLEQKMFRGMNRDGMKAASIYISCRLNGCPRTAHEIAEIFKLDKTSATNGCSMSVNILHNIERSMDPSKQTGLLTSTPASFIDRYCSRLNINHELTVLSKFLATKIERNGIITDNTPHSVAAGIIFFIAQVCNLSISKLDIKLICGVSEVTINKCFKKLYAIKETLIPASIMERYQ